MHIFLFDNTNYNKEKEQEYKNSWYATAEHPACWILHINKHIKKKTSCSEVMHRKKHSYNKGTSNLSDAIRKTIVLFNTEVFCSVLKTSLP